MEYFLPVCDSVRLPFLNADERWHNIRFRRQSPMRKKHAKKRLKSGPVSKKKRAYIEAIAQPAQKLANWLDDLDAKSSILRRRSA